MILHAAGVLVLLLLSLLGIMLVKTFSLKSKQIAPGPWQPVSVDGDGAAQRLSDAVQYQTVAMQEETPDAARAFLDLHDHLKRSFPKVHQEIQRDTVNRFSLLYKWQGSDPTAIPFLFIAHLDVVPANDEGWDHPPFSGAMEDGFIWGRGTADDKGSALALLEAMETLLKEGFRPESTIYVALGHDEETGGQMGAHAIVDHLASEGIRLAFTLDEGGGILQGVFPGIDDPVGFIAVAEKGYVTMEMTAKAEAGHSSMPPRATAIGRLSRAITRLEKHPMPARLTGLGRLTFETLAPEMRFPFRFALSNLWLLSGPMKLFLSKLPAANAAIRTTTAPTIAHAGSKDNVLPAKAKGTVNFRLLPGDSIQDVLLHAQRVIDDPEVQIHATEESVEASPVSDHDNAVFAALAETIRQTFPDAIVAPTLTLGATDSKHFGEISDRCYRFHPLVLKKNELAMIHGKNERVSVKNHINCIQFYAQIMRRMGRGHSSLELDRPSQ